MSLKSAFMFSGLKKATPVLPNLTGLQAWFDITDLTTLTYDGSNRISAITDKTGNGNDLSQDTGASQPLLVLTDSDNGLPAMQITGGTFIGRNFSLSTPYNIYLFVKQSSFAANSEYMHLGGGLNGIVQHTGANNYLSIVSNNDWVIDNRMYYKTKWTMFSFCLNADGTTYVAIDQDAFLGRDSRFTTYTAGNSPISTLRIGGGSNPNFFIQEVLVLNNVLDLATNTQVADYFHRKYNSTLSIPFNAFGDSITKGIAASPLSDSYVNLTCASLGTDAFNFGISGTVVGYNVPPDVNNFDGLVNTVDLGHNINAYTSFCYGTNDEATDTGWKNYYQSKIQYLIDLGYSKDRMVMITPPYNSAFAYLPQTVTYCSQIASALGIRYADCYTYMMNNGGDSLLADGLHPNNAGHAAMAFVVEQSFA